MIKVPNQPKSKEKEGSKEGEREKEPIVLPKPLNKRKIAGQDGESETELDEQLSLLNRDKSYYKVDVRGLVRNQVKRERPD